MSSLLSFDFLPWEGRLASLVTEDGLELLTLLPYLQDYKHTPPQPARFCPAFDPGCCQEGAANNVALD